MDNFKKDFDVVLVNYANNLFRKSQKKNRKTAIKFNSFDRIISYGPNDINEDFLTKNKKILEEKRGNGYWLWKPYFIKKALDDLKWGDFLFYCDSGGYFVNSIQDLISLSLEKKQDVIPFELSHPESEWTKRDTFMLMDCDSPKYYGTNQRLASFVLIKKTELSMSFVKEWLNYAQDERVLTDTANTTGFDNHPNFRDHRHDQSIFSLLSKKYDFTAFRDPSQFGNAVKDLYADSNYDQLINLDRKRNFPIHIKIKKCLKVKKAQIINFFG